MEQKRPEPKIIGGSLSWDRLRKGELSLQEYAAEIEKESAEIAERELARAEARWNENHPSLTSIFLKATKRLGGAMIDGFNFERTPDNQ